MEVAVPEEPQKKIFRARKTMKMSDRQQLEVLHNTLSAHSNSSSRPQTPLVNGTHGEDGSKEKDKETGTKSPASQSSRSSPVPSRSVSLSRSPSPVDSKTRNPSPSFSLKKGSEKSKSEEKKGEKDDKAEEIIAVKTETTKSARSTSPSVSDKKTEQKKTSTDQGLNGELPMDTDSTSLDNGSAEEKSSTSTPSGKKRSLSPVEGKNGWKDGEIKEERDGKRARVEGVQLEAQLELKITANAGSRLKLEKVVQQLVEERLHALQLTVFDRNLEELKDRMEKIDAATKQQKSVHTLKAALINRQGPAVVSITNEQLLTFTQRLLNLEARVGWLEARLNEKALRSHPPTVDQSTSTDSAVDVPLLMPTPLEIQSDCQQSFKTRDHSTSASGQLDDADFGFPPVASKPLTDHTLKVQTVTSLSSATRLGPTNHQLTAASMLDCKSSQVQEHSVKSPPSNTSQYCSKKPRNASHSHHHVRRSLIHGVILPDVILNHVSIKIEKQLYLDSAGSDGRPRADRFAVCLFKRLIPLSIYLNWAGTVNYDGSRGKNALPSNLRQTISDAVARKFHPTAHDWKQIRDRINELLRKKRLSFPLF